VGRIGGRLDGRCDWAEADVKGDFYVIFLGRWSGVIGMFAKLKSKFRWVIVTVAKGGSVCLETKRC